MSNPTNLDGNNITKSWVTISVDWESAKKLHKAYWQYRREFEYLGWANRMPNMPSELTEAIVCLCTNAELIKEGHGDIFLPNTHVGEVKGTSQNCKDGRFDLSSFSPSSEFDELYFVHMGENSNDVYHVYDLQLNRSSILKINVNNSDTFEDHASAGRRPRFSIFEQIVLKNNLNPTWTVNMVAGKIEKCD